MHPPGQGLCQGSASACQPPCLTTRVWTKGLLPQLGCQRAPPWTLQHNARQEDHALPSSVALSVKNCYWNRKRQGKLGQAFPLSVASSMKNLVSKQQDARPCSSFVCGAKRKHLQLKPQDTGQVRPCSSFVCCVDRDHLLLKPQEARQVRSGFSFVCGVKHKHLLL